MRVQLNNAVAVGPTATCFGETPVVGDDGANASRPHRRGGLLAAGRTTSTPSASSLDDLLTPTPDVNVGDHYTARSSACSTTTSATSSSRSPAPADRDPRRRHPRDDRPGRARRARGRDVQRREPRADRTRSRSSTGSPSLIVNNLRSPDLIAVEEVQDNNGATDNGVVDATVTLQQLVDAITAAGGPAYAWREIDPVNDQDGGEPGGNIRQVFLFRTDRGLVVRRPARRRLDRRRTPSSARARSTQLHVQPGPHRRRRLRVERRRKPLAGELTLPRPQAVRDRQPLQLEGRRRPAARALPAAERGQATQRHQQAQLVADFVSQISQRRPERERDRARRPERLRVLRRRCRSSKDAGLHDLMDTLPLNQRYSYEFEGNAQMLDHILVSDPLFAPPARVRPGARQRGVLRPGVRPRPVGRARRVQRPAVGVGRRAVQRRTRARASTLTATGTRPGRRRARLRLGPRRQRQLRDAGPERELLRRDDGPASPVVRRPGDRRLAARPRSRRRR